MSDILADAQEFIGDRHERLQTHTDGCWRWHPACMVARLARELEKTRAALVAVVTQECTLSVSDGRLFVDVDGVEELAFDYAPPTHTTPAQGSEPGEGTFSVDCP